MKRISERDLTLEERMDLCSKSKIKMKIMSEDSLEKYTTGEVFDMTGLMDDYNVPKYINIINGETR